MIKYFQITFSTYGLDVRHQRRVLLSAKISFVGIHERLLLIFIAHAWHPTLFLSFPVNATELQSYIDPRLCVAQPFNNGTA